MDIDKNGELEKTPAATVFGAVYQALAYGVLHFKGPEGETVFVTFKRGLAQHASGDGVDGEAAVQAVLSWREGEYRFIEDVRPDDDDFPPNVPPEIAETLGAGETEVSAAEPDDEVPPWAVLPAGNAGGKASSRTPDDLLDDAAESRFTGCCAVGPAESRLGLFVFIAGKARGGLMWDGERVRRGDDAWSVFRDAFDRVRGDLEYLNLDDEAAEVVALGLAGEAAIARMPAAVINIEEYLAWVQKDKGTVLVSINAGRRAANILIHSGKILGAVVAPHTELAGEADEALALHYTPAATLEVFAAVRRTP
jgi:hypothetical protein